MRAVPIAESPALLVSDTGLSRERSRSATLFALETAKAKAATAYLDLDFRADQWASTGGGGTPSDGVTVRCILHRVDVAMARKRSGSSP